MQTTKHPLQIKTQIYSVLVAALALIGLSLALARISNDHQSIAGWPALLVILLGCAGLIALVWRLLRSEEPPRWLLYLTVTSAVFHLALSIFWLMALPVFGHGMPAEKAGYVMGDAYARDTLAWRLAQSDQPLSFAFTGQRKADQYGGFLFISAAIYRYMGGDTHRPLLVLLLVAVISALAVPFTWGFARLAWGPAEAGLAAWLLALYPEAVLLGSSQMREAMTITLAIAALYGLLRYWKRRSASGRGAWLQLAWVIVPLALFMPISPPLTAMTIVCLGIVALALRFAQPGSAPNQRTLWLGLAALVIVGLIGLYLALRQFAPAGMINPIDMLGWWFTKSAQFQAYVTEHLSGWLQKALKPYPDWLKLPVLLAYGIVQPFLPAALVAGSEAPIWQGIAIWRAVGWTVVLNLLLYAPLLAQRTRQKRALTLALCLVVWLVIVVASVRAGGDMWDNPRYRVTFAGIQASLAAWAWVEHRRVGDVLFRRATFFVGAMLAWFLPWYLRRYTPLVWPITDVFKTAGMGAATAFLLILWDWARAAPIPVPSPAEKPADATPVLDHG